MIRRPAFQKSNILLWIIAGLVVVMVILGVGYLKSGSIAMQLKSDKPLNIVFIFENKGKPLSTQLLMFYPSRSKAALLDIPSNTAVILKTVKRMDRIDYTYKKGKPSAYISEISGYLNVDINGYILLDENGLRDAVDLVDGIQLFIPAMVVQDEPQVVRLPGGAVTLDGDKATQYLLYREENESDSDLIGRRQKLVVALLKKVSEKSTYLSAKGVMGRFTGAMKSNLGNESKNKLFGEMAKLDADSVLMQKMTGVNRKVESQTLFFPFYDGELARDMISQTLNAMNAETGTSPMSKIFTVELLNGTSEKGLASRTGTIFESFGYDVVAIGNAATLDYEKTVIIDRFGEKESLSAIAGVIKCGNFAEAEDYKGSIQADYTIILGKDFNGRVCVR
ncbi:MAG: LCP family protein [Spirochaetaceae bacterium]|nr:LCP family protein [Spirochaetaceae bacterium]